MSDYDPDYARELLSRWEKAKAPDSGSNDDEHEVALDMAEFLQELITEES